MTNGTGRRQAPAARTARRAQAHGGDGRRSRDVLLVAAVQEHHDTDALKALVTEHLGLVKGIARRHATHTEQVEDLVQEGIVGLLKAIQRYEPHRGVPFQAYATTVVTGEIRHHLRDRASCLRLPEPVRNLRTRLHLLAAGVRADAGREPQLAELAALAGASWKEAVEAATASLAPLDGDLAAPETEFGSCEERLELGARLGRLDNREKQVVYYRFFVDLTQQEIAERLGVSQMHVSRLLRLALEKMRVGLPVGGD